ncbi:histidine phosphatase family protein [Limnobacter parvus]|uniref:Phosphoglycerate mutase family protein n=1 Tax=Limnobacter parvus TaxID=2939690 RepID=A0ABT1XIU3_9BURK|nr:histidine phosphatase family protein [Limnobacter parvus]MCR2747205.1 phosphoglycerate mutase family protein [Limnobacter parvus]
MGTIYLVRHGQASFDSADYDQLSELGQLQAAQLGAWFKARKIRLHGFFSGSMNRHLQTAQAFASTYGVFKEPVQHAGLNEYDHEAILQALIGQYDESDAFEKQVMQNADPRKAFQQIFEKAIARWVSGQHDADYPESWATFKTRVMAGLGSVTAQAMQLRQSTASNSSSSSANVVVFTSGGPITVVAQNLLQLPDANAFSLNWMITNCSVSKLLFGQRGISLSSFNEQAHFEGEIAGVLADQANGLEAFATKPNGLISYR